MVTEAKDRVRLQRAARLLAGWHEVRTWVPTKKDALDVQALAAERRAKASLTPALIGEEMKPKNLEKMLRAIADQGSPDYSSPSGPVLDTLSEIAADGDVGDVARGFQLFAHAKPANATFVVAHIPAKILNQYLLKSRGLLASAFFNWEKDNRDWADRLKQLLRNPSAFEAAVDEMALAIGKA